MANKIITLRRRSEFLNIKNKGKKIYSGRWILINYIENQHKVNRYGWTISSKTGSSVLRNKIKRWSRELLRKRPLETGKFYDVNIIIRVNRNADIKKLSYDEFKKSFEAALKQIR